MRFGPATDIPDDRPGKGPTFFSIGAGIGGEILGFIRALFCLIGAWDICPAATAILRRHYAIGSVDIITDDINKPFPMKRLPVGRTDVVTVALQCQCSSTNNYKRSSADKRFDTGERMIHCAIAIRPLVIVIENVANFVEMRSRFKRALEILQNAGYRVEHHTLNSSVWTPSSRCRVFIVASRVSASPMLADLADAVSVMKEKSISEFFPNIQAMWHPVRPGGHGTKSQNQHCIIPARERYPAIDTKCLKRPPRGYRSHYRDHKCGLQGCHYPSVQDLCVMLGFPVDYFTLAEINAPNCTCPACLGHKQPQVAQQLGKCWSPCSAFHIASAISPYLEHSEDMRDRFWEFDVSDAAPGKVLDYLDHFREMVLNSFPSRAGTSPARAHAAFKVHQSFSRVNLTEAVCRQYVQKQERATGRPIENLAPPVEYKLSEVKINPHASEAGKARARAIIEANKACFATHSNMLPKPALDDDGQPVVIEFKFREDHSPRKVPRPNARRGSARVAILSAFRQQYEEMGLIAPCYDSVWANRPHLVAKYAEDAHRAGIPDSIRFTGDLSATNTQIELIPATHGNVQEELNRTAGHAVYCSADAASAYWSFILARKSSEACAVWLPDAHGNWVKYRFSAHDDGREEFVYAHAALLLPRMRAVGNASRELLQSCRRFPGFRHE